MQLKKKSLTTKVVKLYLGIATVKLKSPSKPGLGG